jgi:hypothetical protein
MKKTLIIVGAILIAVLIAAGSFWGGTAYAAHQTSQANANFLNGRGQPGGGQPPDGNPANGEQPPVGGMGLMGGAGTIGQVTKIDGNIITIDTGQGVINVNLSGSTLIEKPENVSISDLQPGMQVQVTGQSDSTGNISADQIQILNNNQPATETVP